MSILSIFNSLASSVFADWQINQNIANAGVNPMVDSRPQLPQAESFPQAGPPLPQEGYAPSPYQPYQGGYQGTPQMPDPESYPQQGVPEFEEILRQPTTMTPSKGGEIYRHYTTEEKAKLIEQTGEIRAGSISKGKYEFYGKGKFGDVAFEIEAKDIPKEYLNPELTEFESIEAKDAFIDRVKSGVVDIGSIPIKKFKRVTPSKWGDAERLIKQLPSVEKLMKLNPSIKTKEQAIKLLNDIKKNYETGNYAEMPTPSK